MPDPASAHHRDGSMMRQVNDGVSTMNDQPDATQVSETAPRRSGDMLRALNAAAAAALRERAAHSPDAVFEAVSRELESLSLYSAVLLLNQDKRQLVVGHVNLGSSTLAAFQKLLGGRLIGYTFPVEWGNIFRQVVETGQTILDPDPMSGILELLPKPLRRPARPIIQAASFGRSITAPLAVDGEVTGVLSVIARTLVPADVPAITAFADLVSAALENAQLYEQLARREREAGAINVIIQALNASRNVKDVFGAVARELGRLVPFDRASIALLNTDPPSFTMHALAALGQPDAPLGAGVTMPLTATAAGPDVLAGQPHLTPDLSTETDFVGERLLYEAGLRSRINVPLVVSDQPIGALNLASTQPAAFSEHHMGLLQQVAGAIASAIQNAQIYERAQESEARYRHLVENVHDLIFELDTEGLIAYCSPSIEHLGGYQAAEVTGRRFVEFIHPDDLPTVLERLDHVLQGDTPQPLEFRLRAQDGRYIWTRTVSRPVMRDNQMMGLTGIASDITARKEAELALQSRDTILNAVSFAAEQFLAPGDFDVSIQAALARLGEAINVSRAYVFENHETADG
ncbi:MAG: PAS domain S-box protein, partial [Chloroflexi bacterium]|nr:PAS domain S-box protein [Chloroflexota bacterium]